MKKALFNRESLHTDEPTGLEAESGSLFLGKKGADHAETLYMTFCSSGRENLSLHISAEDLLVLD